MNMRRMTIVLLVLAAAGLSAQTAPAQAPPENPSPQLLKSGEIQPGDSPLVQAAKRAMAARQKSKNRINVTVATQGHVFQSANQITPIPKVPETPKPAQPRTKAGANPAEIERRIQKLINEQQIYASHADEPMGGDNSEEDYADKRIAELQKQIDGLRRELAQAQASNPPK